MPRRIHDDHKRFRDVVSGRTRRELKKLVETGGIVRRRPRGGKIVITIPRIDIPHFVHGFDDEGVGRGPGSEGDLIGKDPQQGKGQGKGGTEEGQGINVHVDMEEILQFMEDLCLPRLMPKTYEKYDEIRIKYNDISRTGLRSLIHPRRTMKEAIKRLSMCGQLENESLVPGAKVPMRLIVPINSDFRYRQYKEIRVPSSNAVIFFARDCSGSMDSMKCDIVSDIAWWLDCWIRRYYNKVERCYFLHDTIAREVNEKEFYSYRYGGGTICSSVFKLMAEQFKNRFHPSRFNIYVFYFTDGDNWFGDNEVLLKIIKEKYTPDVVNALGIEQVCSWGLSQETVIGLIRKAKQDSILSDLNVHEHEITSEDVKTEESRNEVILKAISALLGVREY